MTDIFDRAYGIDDLRARISELEAELFRANESINEWKAKYRQVKDTLVALEKVRDGEVSSASTSGFVGLINRAERAEAERAHWKLKFREAQEEIGQISEVCKESDSRLATATGLLRKLEWPVAGQGINYCKICKAGDSETRIGHYSDCRLADFLKGADE